MEEIKEKDKVCRKLNKMKQCISKERIDCLYFTKETKDEDLKILEPNLETKDYVIINESKKGVIIDYPGFYKVFYIYNSWYVRDDILRFTHYTDEEFKKEFELVDD